MGVDRPPLALNYLLKYNQNQKQRKPSDFLAVQAGIYVSESRELDALRNEKSPAEWRQMT
jgi:hypothetical protein